MAFHVNPATGDVGPCKATEKCPFGDLAEDHYPTAKEARASYELAHEPFQKQARNGNPLVRLAADFGAFLGSYVKGHKRVQGEDFEDFFAAHLQASKLRELDLATASPEEASKLKEGLANLKALAVDDITPAANPLEGSWFMRHPFGEYNAPDFVIASGDHLYSVELKSSNSFTYIMFGRHFPKVTDVYVLGDFSSKKDLTFLTVGDLVSGEKLRAYEELKEEALALKAKSKAIGDELSFDIPLLPRSGPPHPFTHPDRKAREARVLALFEESSL